MDEPPRETGDEVTPYDAERETFESALARFDEGASEAIAVLSEPFGWRSRFLDDAAARYGDRVTRVQCTPTLHKDEEFELTADGDVLVVDDCQHLFVRRIGGFGRFDRFLRQVATFEGLVVTSWNSFCWNYLVAAKSLADTFPTQVRLGDLDSSQIEAFLTEEVGGELPEFVDDRDQTAEPLVRRTDHSFSLGGRKVRVPLPVIDGDAVRQRWAARDGGDISAFVFDRLTKLAGGNPGVARHLWEERVTDGQLHLSSVDDEVGELGLEYDTAFLLQVLVTKERIPRDELASVVARADVDRQVGQLQKAGILTVEDDLIHLTPSALQPVLDLLERRHIVW